VKAEFKEKIMGEVLRRSFDTHWARNHGRTSAVGGEHEGTLAIIPPTLVPR